MKIVIILLAIIILTILFQNNSLHESLSYNNIIYIIIPTIKRTHNYINNTINKLYENKSKHTKLIIYIHVGDSKQLNNNKNSTTHIDIKIKQKTNILVTHINEHVTLNHNQSDYMYWREKQNLDYRSTIVKFNSSLKKRPKYILFLEDDQLAIKNWDIVILKYMQMLNHRNDISHVKMSPLGMCAYLFNLNHMVLFSEYLYKYSKKKPCDWVIDIFLKKTKLKKIDSYKYIFEHDGYYSSLKGKIQELKVF